MKKPELLLLIAIWEFIAAFISLIGIAAVVLFGFLAVVESSSSFGTMPDRTGRIGAIFGLSIALLVLLIYIGVSVTGGIGLLMGREWGRIVSIVQAALGLFSIPFGTIIGILVIIYLTRSSVREYFTKKDVLIPPLASPPSSPTNPPS